MKHSHYYKEWCGKIDVYRVIDLYGVNHPAIQHALKKLLCGGSRGAKGKLKDWQEALDSIQRAIEMVSEEGEPEKPIWPKTERRVDIIGSNGNDGLIYRFVEAYQDGFEE